MVDVPAQQKRDKTRDTVDLQSKEDLGATRDQYVAGDKAPEHYYNCPRKSDVIGTAVPQNEDETNDDTKPQNQAATLCSQYAARTEANESYYNDWRKKEAEGAADLQTHKHYNDQVRDDGMTHAVEQRDLGAPSNRDLATQLRHVEENDRMEAEARTAKKQKILHRRWSYLQDSPTALEAWMQRHGIDDHLYGYMSLEQQFLHYMRTQLRVPAGERRASPRRTSGPPTDLELAEFVREQADRFWEEDQTEKVHYFATKLQPIADNGPQQHPLSQVQQLLADAVRPYARADRTEAPSPSTEAWVAKTLNLVQRVARQVQCLKEQRRALLRADPLQSGALRPAPCNQQNPEEHAGHWPLEGDEMNLTALRRRWTIGV